MTPAKRVIPVMTAVLLLGITILLVPEALHEIPRAHGANKTVSLIGNYQGWNYSQPSGVNPTITVNEGDALIIHLTSVDITHQFALDLDRDGPKFLGTCPSGDLCYGDFGPTTPSTISINVNFATNTYQYFCIYHPAMVGNFVVQSSPTPDFGVGANPTSISILQGSSATSTITVTSQNLFNGTIGLSTSSSPPGPTMTLKPPSVTISSSAPQQTSTLSVNTTTATPTGRYTITVTGKNGTMGPSHTTVISVTITSPDFSVTASPTSIGVIRGSIGNTTTITLSSLNGFAGTISLTATPSHSGLGAYFNPTSVTIPSGGSGTSTMTVTTSSTPPGLYSISVNGTSGSKANTTMVGIVVTIPDFALNPSPLWGLSLAQGSNATTTITLTSLHMFKGNLTLSAVVSPSGPNISFNPASVSLSSRRSIASVMTVSTKGSVGAGIYTVNVTATDGVLTHSTILRVTVTSTTGSLPITVLVGAGVIVVAAVVVTILLVSRRTSSRGRDVVGDSSLSQDS